MPKSSHESSHPDTATILVVDDELHYRQLTELNLNLRGYTVVTAENGSTALALAAQFSPELVLLDIMLPDLNGFEVCRQLRKFTDVPILMLTARTDERDRVRGLDWGADDYITKPFGVAELLARVRAQLRRAYVKTQTIQESVQQIGRLTLDRIRQHVLLDGKEIVLTQTEYRLLDTLARNLGYVVTIAALEESLWGSQSGDGERAIRQTIYRLRQKLEGPTPPQHFIQTRSGVGYLLTTPDQPNADTP